MSLDTIGGFGNESSKKKYLHLLVDHFTRFAFASYSKTQNSSDFITLVKKVHSEHPIGTLLTDQFGGLASKEFLHFLDKENIQHIFVAVDAAFSNGINERLNQTIVNRIRCRFNEDRNQKPWFSVAKRCLQEYNSTPHSVTRFSPRYLMTGERSLIIPKEIVPASSLEEDTKTAFKNSIHNHNLNKKRYDRRAIDHEFQVGDLVYVENGNKLNRNKLDNIRIGPYPISEKLSNTVYRVKCSILERSNRLFHISKMVPCYDSPLVP